VTILSGETSFTSYTLWSPSTSIFINSDSTGASVTVNSRRTVCQSLSSTRWQCEFAQSGQQYAPAVQTLPATTAVAITAPTPSDHGKLFTLVQSTATTATVANTLALYSCTAALSGTYHDFLVYTTTTLTAKQSPYLTITTNAINWAINNLKAAAKTGVAGNAAGTASADGTSIYSKEGSGTSASIPLLGDGAIAGDFTQFRVLCTNGVWFLTGTQLNTA